MKPFYRPILLEAWRLGRLHLFLWPLAFFAYFLGIAGTFQAVADIFAASEPSLSVISVFDSDFMTSIFLTWSQSFNLIPWENVLLFTAAEYIILIFFFLLLFILIIIAVVAVSSEGGLVHGIQRLFDGSKTGYLESFRKGLDNFPYLFVTHVLYVLLYVLIFGLFILPLHNVVMFRGSITALMTGILLYFIIIPILIILNLVRRYTILFIMTKSYQKDELLPKITRAFTDAWLLFRTNWVISLETACIILVIFLAFIIVSALMLMGALVLFTLFGAILSFSNLAAQFAVNAMFLVLLAIGIIIWSFFTTFQMTIWVAVFRRIASGQPYRSKLHRLTQHLPWLHQKVM